jgi:hypothetical protein
MGELAKVKTGATLFKHKTQMLNKQNLCESPGAFASGVLSFGPFPQTKKTAQCGG